jgi:hypothetical protein
MPLRRRIHSVCRYQCRGRACGNGGDVLWCDFLQEADVLIRVVGCHVNLGDWFGSLARSVSGSSCDSRERSDGTNWCSMRLQTYENFHLLVQAVPRDEAVGHLNPEWLHVVTWLKHVEANVFVVDIRDIFLAPRKGENANRNVAPHFEVVVLMGSGDFRGKRRRKRLNLEK